MESTLSRMQSRNLLTNTSKRTYALAILMATLLVGCSSELDRCVEANQEDIDTKKQWLEFNYASLPKSILNLPIKHIKEIDEAYVEEMMSYDQYVNSPMEGKGFDEVYEYEKELWLSRTGSSVIGFEITNVEELYFSHDKSSDVILAIALTPKIEKQRKPDFWISHSYEFARNNLLNSYIDHYYELYSEKYAEVFNREAKLICNAQGIY
jgi:hypothetical protein